MKSVLLVVVLLCLSFVSLTAQAVGGGLSVFVPEELYTSGQGTVAFEQGLSTSIGFGDLLSIPIGVAYHAAGSFVLDPAEHPDHVGPDLYGDVLIPSVQVKMHVGLGSLVYVGWRAIRSQTTRMTSRVIGPDDDPEFLRRLGRGDK